MRALTTFLGALLSMLWLPGCQPFDLRPTPTVPLASQPDWPTLRFKPGYTLQLPAHYVGPGAVGFEGLTFQKNRPDGRVELRYFFCEPTVCHPFGATLARLSRRLTVPRRWPNRTAAPHETITLDRQLHLRDGRGRLSAVFYYVDEPTAQGVLYMRVDGRFREALTVTYAPALRGEVVAILRSIRPG